MSRNRAYCFTINNFSDEDIDSCKVLGDISSYLIVGKERGENDTPHLQGYVYFKDAKTFSSVKKKLPRAHIEASKGSPVDNKRYCSKQEVIYEKGELPKQGERTDLEKVIGELKSGANMRGIIENARSVQSVKIAEVWLKYNEKGRFWKSDIRWYHGSTGSGKSRSAEEWLGPDRYKVPANMKWWEGYDAHENVWIDEFRAHCMKMSDLLQLLDRYEYRVECKGGMRQMVAKKIAITSPYHPRDVYDNHEDKEQLVRRIGEENIILCGDKVERKKEDYAIELIG